jgi:hypothetical protein
MSGSFNSRSLSTLCALAIASLPTSMAMADASSDSSPIIEKVRHATARFVNINVALAEGWVPATPCVSGPDTGAMGVHLVLPARLDQIALKGDTPEALIYEPMTNGAMRLVGVEFIVKKSVWELTNPPPAVPAVEGNLMNLIGEPNRFGLPAFYEVHVWAWQDNPRGTFADWNTRVTCDAQAVSPSTAAQH